MPSQIEILPGEDKELAFSCHLDVDPAFAYRAWIDPELMVHWFTPAPWTTVAAVTDPRPMGKSSVTMRGPEGEEHVSHGLYLELVENRKIVFTDAFLDAWTPADKAFMVAILTFEPEAGGTRYTARARHWSADDCRAHQDMGFHEGWHAAAGQLEELGRRLAG